MFQLSEPTTVYGQFIDRAVSSCGSSTFALRTLKPHVLRPQELHLLAKVTTVAFLQNASMAWWGFATKGAAERPGAPSEGAPKMCLPGSRLPVV